LYNRKFTEITVIGKDKKGVIARFTTFLFENSINIEDLDQNVIRGMFSMTLHADASNMSISKNELENGLIKLAAEMNMDVKIRFPGSISMPKMAIMVTKESHCLETLVKAWHDNEINVDIPCIIASCDDLKPIAVKENIPFYVFDAKDRRENEAGMLKTLEELEVDFIVLARYMKILSPDFVWRYENRIINIHPSLLPAFPGAQAYRQAIEKGVRIIGVTAHFVTMDLDQGPIITQKAFNISSNASINEIKQKGRELEQEALLEAVVKFLSGELKIHWGKVYEKNGLY
jgi:formyltetrahydrofolate deformylase